MSKNAPEEYRVFIEAVRENIRRTIDEMDAKQADVAAAAEISQKTLAKIEGKTELPTLTLRTVFNLAWVLDVPVEQLLRRPGA